LPMSLIFLFIPPMLIGLAAMYLLLKVGKDD
jgi:hypothetical protein